MTSHIEKPYSEENRLNEKGPQRLHDTKRSLFHPRTPEEGVYVPGTKASVASTLGVFKIPVFIHSNSLNFSSWDFLLYLFITKG